MRRPGKAPIEAYAGDAQGVAVALKNKEGNPFPMNLLGPIEVALFPALGEANPFFSPVVTVHDNVITFIVPGIQTMRLRGQVVYWQMRSTLEGRPVTLLADTFSIRDVRSQRGVSDTVINAIVNIQDLVVDATLGDAAALAAQSRADSAPWEEGDDQAVEALGGQKSAKGWVGEAKDEADRATQVGNTLQGAVDQAQGFSNALAPALQDIETATQNANTATGDAVTATNNANEAVAIFTDVITDENQPWEAN